MEGGVRWEGHFSGSKGLGGKEWMHLQSEQALRLIYVTDPKPSHKSSTTSPQTHTTLNLAKQKQCNVFMEVHRSSVKNLERERTRTQTQTQTHAVAVTSASLSLFHIINTNCNSCYDLLRNTEGRMFTARVNL